METQMMVFSELNMINNSCRNATRMEICNVSCVVNKSNEEE